jgi:hypothetical protein
MEKIENEGFHDSGVGEWKANGVFTLGRRPRSWGEGEKEVFECERLRAHIAGSSCGEGVERASQRINHPAPVRAVALLHRETRDMGEGIHVFSHPFRLYMSIDQLACRALRDEPSFVQYPHTISESFEIGDLV